MGAVNRSNRGLSLLETVIGFFLLVLIILGALRLFDAGLYYSSLAQQNAVAVRIAQRTLDEIRVWAQTPTAGGLQYDDWGFWSGYNQQDPDEPGYRVTVQVADQELKSPSSRMEESYPLLEQKLLQSSCKRVEIRVSWRGGQREFVLHSLVAEPGRPLPITVEVSAVGGSPNLNPEETADFVARALDAQGGVIEDVFFHWNVRPGPTNGAIEQSRTGQTARFVHAVRLPNLPTLYTRGDAVVEASTVYHGRPVRGESRPFQLNTP